ncbi:hypothetical protein ACFSHQ_18460 [Gemmobacter lanyuensis]
MRAAREDEIAAWANGVNVSRQRFVAWVLGAIVSGTAGVLLAHFLGAFSPKDFHFNLTFLLMSMLILGGVSTVSGAVGGTALIVVMVDLLRRLEGGAEVFGVTLPEVFGLTDIGVGLVILAVMYRLRDGLFGLREVDERLFPNLPSLQPLRRKPRHPRRHRCLFKAWGDDLRDWSLWKMSALPFVPDLSLV